MAELPGTARVVIIGGGAVGVSGLYHLALAGWTDCLLLEKNELTAGSTWHAAGNCPHFSTSWAVMQMQRYSLALYRELAERVDYPMNYHVTGSLRLAHSKTRLQEFEQVAAMAHHQGLQMDMLAPGELQARHPFLETHDLAGGLWDPLDGDIDPAQLTQALAKGARELGQRIARFTQAEGIDREGDHWLINTDRGTVRCDVVVNAAGYQASRVAEWFKPFGGRDVPATVMSHQYFLTEEIPEIQAWSEENRRNLPIVRDVDSSYYLRQDKHGLNLGPYERNCRAHWVTPNDPMPDDFSFQLFPDDLDRLEWYIEDAMERVPLLGTQGIGRVINGPIPYAPDGLPLIGPMPGIRQAFEAHSFTFGIVQAGGAGKVLAEWITRGETEWDCRDVDPRRFTDHADADYCRDKAMETYGHEYAMHFPHREWPAGRSRKCSAAHEAMAALGAQFGVVNGWERANWYAQPGDDTSAAATQTWSRNGPWRERVREECEAVRDHVGVLNLCGFSRLTLAGTGAAEWLAMQITGTVPHIGRLGLGYFASSSGRLVTELSMLRIDEDKILLIGAAAARWHDRDWLAAALPEHLTLSDVTAQSETLLVTGPDSRTLLTGLSPDADLSLGWLSHQCASLVGRPVRLVRVSYAGELGWEIHSACSDVPVLLHAIVDAGARPFGMIALDALRIEKGYRNWKSDLSCAYTPLEAALDRFIDWDKDAFIGQSALQAERQRGSTRRVVTLIVDSTEFDPPPMSTVWHGDTMVGETTSSAWGHRVDACIALGMIRTDLAKPGTSLEVELFGSRHAATVQPEQPLWDPENARMRS